MVNPYDPCFANKMVNGKQLMITWHVDDLNASHVDRKIINEFVKWVNDKYGSISKLTVTREKLHTYLGMKLDYTKKGKVIVDMTDYVQRDIVDVYEGEISKKKVKTPATENLFRIKKNSPQLEKK